MSLVVSIFYFKKAFISLNNWFVWKVNDLFYLFFSPYSLYYNDSRIRVVFLFLKKARIETAFNVTRLLHNWIIVSRAGLKKTFFFFFLAKINESPWMNRIKLASSISSSLKLHSYFFLFLVQVATCRKKNGPHRPSARKKKKKSANFNHRQGR